MTDNFLVSVAKPGDSEEKTKILLSEDSFLDEKKQVSKKERRKDGGRRVNFNPQVQVTKGIWTSAIRLPTTESDDSSSNTPLNIDYPNYPRLNSVPTLAHRPGLAELEPVDYFRIGEVVSVLASCGKRKRKVYVPALVTDFSNVKGVTYYSIQVPKYQLWKCEEFYVNVTVPRLRQPKYFESKMFLLNEFRAGDKVKTIVKKKGEKSLLLQGTICRQNSDHSYDIIVPNFAKLNLKPEMRMPIESIQQLNQGNSRISELRTSELPLRDIPLFARQSSSSERTNMSSFLACSFQLTNIQRVDLFSSPNPYIVVYTKNSIGGIIPLGVTEWIRSSQHPHFRTEIVIPYIATNPGCIYIDVRHNPIGLKSVRKSNYLLASGELSLLSLKESSIVTLHLNQLGQEPGKEPDGRKEPTILTVMASPITPGNVKTLSTFSPTPPKLEKDDKPCVRIRGIPMKRKFISGNGFELREVPKVNSLAEKDPLLRWLDEYEEKLDTVFTYSDYMEEPEQTTVSGHVRSKHAQSERSLSESKEKERELDMLNKRDSVEVNRKPLRSIMRRKDVVSWLLLSWSQLLENLYILSGTDRRRVFDVLINIISREEFDLANELFTYENLRTYLGLLKELCLEALQLLQWADDTDRRFCSEVFVICYFRLPGFRYTILEVFGIPGDLDEKEQELWQEHRLQVSAWLTQILQRDQMMLFSATDNPSLFPGMWDRAYLRASGRNFSSRKMAFLSTGEQVVIEKVRGSAVVVRIPFVEKKESRDWDKQKVSTPSDSVWTDMFGVSVDGLQKHPPISAYDEDIQKGLSNLQTSIRDNQNWKIGFFHAFVNAIQRQRHGRLYIVDIEGAYEIIGTITTYFLYVGHTWWKSSRLDIVDAVSEAIGAHNVLLSPFMKAVWIKTNVRNVAHVNTALVFLDRWLERSRTVMDTQLPETFDYQFFWKGLAILLDQEHSGILAKTLHLIYSHIDIFRETFRLYILDYLLEGSRFVKYFLHWAPIVRNFYFSILAYKINRCGCGHYMPFQKSFHMIVKLVKERNLEEKENVTRNSKKRSSKLRLGDKGRKPLSSLTQGVRDMMRKIHRENTRWFVSDLKKSQCDIIETSMTATKKQNDLKALTVLRAHITEILDVYENKGGPFVPDVQNALIPIAMKQFSDVCDVAVKAQQYYTVKETPNDRHTIGYSVCPRLEYAIQADPLKPKSNIHKFMN